MKGKRTRGFSRFRGKAGFPIGELTLMLHGEGWRSGPGHLALEKTFSTFISVAASGPRVETDLVLRRLPMTPGAS